MLSFQNNWKLFEKIFSIKKLHLSEELQFFLQKLFASSKKVISALTIESFLLYWMKSFSSFPLTQDSTEELLMRKSWSGKTLTSSHKTSLPCCERVVHHGGWALAPATAYAINLFNGTFSCINLMLNIIIFIAHVSSRQTVKPGVQSYRRAAEL